MLDTKRQMTNKENNPPAMTTTVTLPSSSGDAIASSSTAPEKPIRKDLRRIHDESSFLDNSTSYICDNSGDPEYSMINRLMADFNLNRDSVIGQKRTPLKSLKIPDATAKVASPIKMASPYKPSASARNMSFGQDESAVRSDAHADDTLEEMEYVLDRGLNYVPKRLREQLEQQREQESSASDDTASTVRRVELPTDGKDGSDDDNENDGNCESNNSENHGPDGSNDKSIGKEDDDDDVIFIESSPESSFTTTTGHFRSAVGSVENTFYTAKSDLHRGSTSSNQSSTLINRSEMDQQNDRSDVIVLDDSGINRSASLDDSDALNAQNDSDRSLDAMPNFNDTLERVEYYMAQAEKMMQKAKASPKPATPVVQLLAHPSTPQQARLLKAATPKSAKAITPTVKLLKAHTPNPKLLTPDIGSGKKALPTSAKKAAPRVLTPVAMDAFKRPARSPAVQVRSASKLADARPPTRIPSKLKAPSSLQKSQFRHIASPIAAYINHTPQVPLMKTVKSAKSLQQNKAFAVPSAGRDLDESVQSTETFSAKTPLPCKMYTSAAQRQVTLND